MNIKIEPQELENIEINSGSKNWVHFAQQILTKTQPPLLHEKWNISKMLISDQNELSNQPKNQKYHFKKRIKIILDKGRENLEAIKFFYKMSESPSKYLLNNGKEVIEFKTDRSRSQFLKKCQKMHNWLRVQILKRTEVDYYSISEDEKEEVIYNFLQTSNVNENSQNLQTTTAKIEEEEEEKKEKTPTYEKIHQCQCDKKLEIIKEKLDLILKIVSAPSNSGGKVETKFEREK